MDKNNFDARMSYSMTLCRLGEIERAIEEGHKVEKMRPDDQMVHTNLSLFYVKVGNKNLPDIGWVGSLDSLYADKGYWVRLDENANLPVYGLPSEDVQYFIHEGANLISYPYEGIQSIDDALPEEIHQDIWAIFGQGISAMNINGTWMGALNSFEGGYGYWIIATDNFVFELSDTKS